MPIPRRLRIAAMVSAGVLAIAVMGLWLGVPAVARWGIETVGSREIGRALQVGDIRFNPFTLRATLAGLSVAGLPDESTPLLTIETLEAHLSIATLRHRAPVIGALRAQGVRARLIRVAENHFNFSDIVDRMMAKPARPEPARFALYNVEINDAAIALDDRVLKSKHTLDAIQLGLPFISSLPDDVEVQVRPSFSARLDGHPIALTAETQPFDPALHASVALRFSGIDLPRYLGYLPLRPNFDLLRGALDTDLRVLFRRAVPATKADPGHTAQLSLSGALAIREFALAERGAASPLLSWRRLDVALNDVALRDGLAKIRAITLDGAQANIVRRADGSIAGETVLSEPVDLPASRKVTTASPEASKPFAFELGELKISDAAVDFKDDGVRFARRIAPIAVEVKGLSNRPDALARLTSSLTADDQTQLRIEGDVGVAPLRLALVAEMSSLPLNSALPYLRAFTTARIDGTMDAGARLLIEQSDTGVVIKVDDAHADAKSLRLRDSADGAAALDLTRLTLSGGAIDFAQRAAVLGQIKGDGLRLIATRLADGTLDWARLIVEQKTPPAGAAPPPPWKVRVGEAQLNGGRIIVTDESVTPAARLAADSLNVSVRDYAIDGHERTTLSLRARTGGGTVNSRGWLRVTPLASNLDLDVQNVDVGALRPYLKEHANAVLTSASVWTKGRLALASGKAVKEGSALRVAYDGSARVTNLALLDGSGEGDLLRWQALSLGTVKLRIGEGAPEIQMDAVQLSGFFARVILSAEGRLNLVGVFKSPLAPDTGTQEELAESPTSSPATADARAPARPLITAAARAFAKPLIRIDGIELERGNVNFTDNFVKPNYTANLTDLGGTISALATNAADPADVSIRGRVDSDAPVEITGKVNPLAPKLFLDIAASAKGVELPRLTPYSVKYAGYPITKGKLSMDVRYSIDNDQLKAENHLFLDQLTFGERVDSPTATKLPVLFAVSMLKNRRGEIDINLPVSGSLNDPQFSIGAIIVRVIVNLLVKVVTAPFSFLAAAFGGGEELGYLEFPPGTAVPTAAEAKKLDTLSKALDDRPSLRLEVTGRADPAADTEPLRASKLDAKLRAAKVRDIVRAGDSVDPATVTISEAERPALIARAYADEKIPDKPRNVIGIAKTIPTADMEKLILSTISVDDEDLRKLANDRAAKVRDQLEAQGKVPRERIFLVAPKLNAEGIQDKGRPTRVDFSLK